MPYTIHFRQQIEAHSLKPVMTQAAAETLSSEQAEPGSLTLVVTDEASIRQLNNEYAGIDRPTDVLAFPSPEPDPDEEGVYYGDVIIALPIAQAQASQRRHSIQDECVLLTIHGTLHLLGYDHATQAEKDKMWARQAMVLNNLGMSAIETDL
jgi:probable rRNA maturation factor